MPIFVSNLTQKRSPWDLQAPLGSWAWWAGLPGAAGGGGQRGRGLGVQSPPRPPSPDAELPYCWRQLSHRAGSPGILISGLRSPGNPESILQATSNLRQVPPGILEMLLGAHGFGVWRKQKASFWAVWRIPGSPWESPWHRWAPSLSLHLLSQLPSGASALSPEPP